MSFVSALFASLSLMLTTAAQADMDRPITMDDLSGTTWSIAVPNQYPATLQFTDQGFSIIGTCTGLEIAAADAPNASVAVISTSEIYDCGARQDAEAVIIETLQSLKSITSETPDMLTLTAKDGSTVKAMR